MKGDYVVHKKHEGFYGLPEPMTHSRSKFWQLWNAHQASVYSSTHGDCLQHTEALSSARIPAYAVQPLVALKGFRPGARGVNLAGKVKNLFLVTIDVYRLENRKIEVCRVSGGGRTHGGLGLRAGLRSRIKKIQLRFWLRLLAFWKNYDSDSDSDSLHSEKLRLRLWLQELFWGPTPTPIIRNIAS